MGRILLGIIFAAHVAGGMIVRDIQKFVRLDAVHALIINVFVFLPGFPQVQIGLHAEPEAGTAPGDSPVASYSVIDNVVMHAG